MDEEPPAAEEPPAEDVPAAEDVDAFCDEPLPVTEEDPSSDEPLPVEFPADETSTEEERGPELLWVGPLLDTLVDVLPPVDVDTPAAEEEGVMVLLLLGREVLAGSEPLWPPLALEALARELELAALLPPLEEDEDEEEEDEDDDDVLSSPVRPVHPTAKVNPTNTHARRNAPQPMVQPPQKVAAREPWRRPLSNWR